MAGVLIRNTEALEVMENVDTLVVDKTGTLTEGKPKLVTIEPRGWGLCRPRRGTEPNGGRLAPGRDSPWNVR